MVDIGLWVTNGCLASGVLTLVDAFSIANIWHRSIKGENTPPLFSTKIISTDGKPVVARGNVRLQPEAAIPQVETTDCIVISPILPKMTPMPEDFDLLSRWLIKMKNQKTLIATICTGSFLLAETGLLAGKKATTNWQFASLFKRQYPGVTLISEDILVEDDGIITTGAATAVNNLAIHLIRRFGYGKLSQSCSKALLIDPNRVKQAPYIMSMPLKSHGDIQVLKAQKMIETNYATIQTIDELARDVGISTRHFIRRFKKATGDLPLRYLRRVRLEAAKEKLETTNDSVDEITLSLGYKDTSSFCRLFKQYTQISPKNYREKFFHRLHE